MVSKSGQDLNVAVDDLEAVPVVLGSIQLPGGFAPQRRDWRNEVAKRLRQAKIRPAKGNNGDARGHPNVERRASGRTRSGVSDQLRAAGDAERVAREIVDIERRVKGKNQSLGTRLRSGARRCCPPTGTSSSTRGS